MLLNPLVRRMPLSNPANLPRVPGVTVLLPAYNVQGFIANCIQSILTQSFSDFELLIINDGSTDDTAAICESFSDPRIRLIHNEGNRGITHTLNRGVSLASASLIARMDADDVAHPNRLARQVEYLNRHPQAGAVSAWVRPVDSDGRPIRYQGTSPTEPGYLSWALLYRNPVSHPAIMMRTDLVRALNGYGDEETLCEDYGLWSRMHAVQPIHILPETLIDYRVHSDGVSVRYMKRQGMHACRIARNNMERLLEAPVDIRPVSVIYYAGQGLRTAYSPKVVLAALYLLEQLYFHFPSVHPVSRTAHHSIVGDLRYLLRHLLHQLPPLWRWRLLTRPGFIRDTLDAGSAVLSLYNWKHIAKTLLNRPPSPVIPPLFSNAIEY